MPAELFDTHCHLNLAEHFPDPDTSKRAVEIAERHEGVYAIVGWHPNSAANWNRSHLSDLTDLLRSAKTVALGEIGLDYHWDFATPEQQQECLVNQLELPAEM